MAAAGHDRLIDAFTPRVRLSQGKRRERVRAGVVVTDLGSRLQAPTPAAYRLSQEGANATFELQG
jgi:hypothetical protein